MPTQGCAMVEHSATADEGPGGDRKASACEGRASDAVAGGSLDQKISNNGDQQMSGRICSETQGEKVEDSQGERADLTQTAGDKMLKHDRPENKDEIEVNDMPATGERVGTDMCDNGKAQEVKESNHRSPKDEANGATGNVAKEGTDEAVPGQVLKSRDQPMEGTQNQSDPNNCAGDMRDSVKRSCDDQSSSDEKPKRAKTDDK